jgi:hypothetical protein
MGWAILIISDVRDVVFGLTDVQAKAMGGAPASHRGSAWLSVGVG